MTLLQVRDLTAGYGKLPVIHGVSLAVAANETVALVGPNGAGKSTLMKSIFRTIVPMSGEVHLDGADLGSVATSQMVRRGMAFVPQGSNTFPSLTVEENLRVALMPMGRSKTATGIGAAFDRFPSLAKRRTSSASTLSGGERQMLAVAGALASEPKFLALDEPTTGLAPTIVNELITRLGEAAKEGIGVLWVVEENPAVILPHCDRVHIMQGGRISDEQDVAAVLADEGLRRLFFGIDEHR
ncbi:branched-chain amino acid ABC transporter ATP-binding protein [Mycolicibacterium aurum]|uniref:Branched-chain amino acid ABC transporter ATP-binding protein n=1 Tax=Mycolicibacterium aurum TaxID=1791 RepID=A0A448IN17_MYCAU|nr:ABC transporter ATP-binding protein [Mycolicibacterium aurum]VEG53826.1 branched-chain amino acid ABC transporter ATP-binding protein [Mycolicibacterium aurum]